MNYYIRELWDSEGIKRLGGTKARFDAESIFEMNGLIPIDTVVTKTKGFWGKLTRHFIVMKKWDKIFANGKKDDVYVFQYRIMDHTIFLSNAIRRAQKRGLHIIFLIHDIESIQANLPFFRKLRFKLEEKSFKYVDKIIVHNESMKYFLSNRGIEERKMINLNIFDYYVTDIDEDRLGERDISLDGPVVISGNLAREKSGYVYKLPDSAKFNLYGINYKTDNNAENVKYMGAFDPDEVPYVMNGSFGLVWDGNDINTCSGSYGQYLKINNPHKTSLYLMSELPVVIWDEAALSSFIKTNKCGITVRSLNDLGRAIASVSEAEYKEMLENTRTIGEKLRKGFFLSEALKKALGD